MVDFSNADPYNPYGGLLSNPVYGQGILNMPQATAPQPGFSPVPQPQQPQPGRFGGFLQNNSNSLMSLGSALLSNPNFGMALANFGQQAPQSMANDRRRKALNNWLKAKSSGGSLDPDTLALLQSDPDLSAKYAMASLVPQKPGTDAIAEYALAKQQGYAGSFMDYERDMKSAGGTPNVVELFDEKTGLPYKAVYNPATKGYERLGGTKAPTGWTVQTGPDGQTTISQGPVNSKPTEFQGKSHLYAARMSEADKTITDLEGAGTNLVQQGLSNVPVAGNYLISSDYQKFDQAKRDFLNAVLRQESGATITPSEFANGEKQYFPQPGDGPDVIAQKRANRRLAIEKIQENAGPAFNQPGDQQDGAGWMDLGNGVRIRAVGQ